MMLSVAMLSGGKARSGNGDGLFVCSIREIASDSGRNDYLCSTKDRLLRGRPCPGARPFCRAAGVETELSTLKAFRHEETGDALPAFRRAGRRGMHGQDRKKNRAERTRPDDAHSDLLPQLQRGRYPIQGGRRVDHEPRLQEYRPCPGHSFHDSAGRYQRCHHRFDESQPMGRDSGQLARLPAGRECAVGDRDQRSDRDDRAGLRGAGHAFRHVYRQSGRAYAGLLERDSRAHLEVVGSEGCLPQVRLWGRSPDAGGFLYGRGFLENVRCRAGAREELPGQVPASGPVRSIPR